MDSTHVIGKKNAHANTTCHRRINRIYTVAIHWGTIYSSLNTVNMQAILPTQPTGVLLCQQATQRPLGSPCLKTNQLPLTITQLTGCHTHIYIHVHSPRFATQQAPDRLLHIQHMHWLPHFLSPLITTRTQNIIAVPHSAHGPSCTQQIDSYIQASKKHPGRHT